MVQFLPTTVVTPVCANKSLHAKTPFLKEFKRGRFKMNQYLLKEK